VLGACGVELNTAKALRRKLIWPSSALLSGMIVAFVLGTETAWPVTFLIAAAAS
jgi:hypothetical protein